MDFSAYITFLYIKNDLVTTICKSAYDNKQACKVLKASHLIVGGIRMELFTVLFRSYASANAGQKQRWSYAHGPSDAPLLGSTIGQALQDWVELRPSKEAAVFCTGNIRKTFQQILEEVQKDSPHFS
jgi:hypothetical protein